jgi:hypothetical protein
MNQHRLMATRLLAVMLTLLIGSPVCWCCVSHAQPAVSPPNEVAACPMCAKKAAEKGVPAKKKSCQCERACSAREITQPTVAVPAAPRTELPPVGWVWEDSAFSTAIDFAATFDFPVHETGPPRPVGALYLRHCALLN